MVLDLLMPPKQDVVIDETFDGAIIDPAWVRVDAPSASHVVWRQTQGRMSADHNSTADASTSVHALMRPIDIGAAAGSYTIETFVQVKGPYDDPHAMSGLIFANGTTVGAGLQQWFMVWQTNSIGSLNCGQRDFVGYNSETAAGDIPGVQYGFATAGVYLRFVWSAANTWTCGVSNDSINWLVYQRSRTMTPTHIGIASGNWGYATHATASYAYFRTYHNANPQWVNDTL